MYREKIIVPKLGFVDDLFDIQKCKKYTKLVNIYTNEEISKRKLQLSKDKCKRMHIEPKSSKSINKCDELYIDNWSVIVSKSEGRSSKLVDVFNQQVVIKSVESMDYLGDVVSCDATNTLNIQSRVTKGQGVITDILQIIEGIYFGEFTFEAFIMLRSSLFLSVITNNLEVSVLNKTDVKTLESLDHQLIRRALQINSKQSTVLMMLELGIMSIKYVLIKKRLMYLHHIMNSNEKSLINQIFHEMLKSPLKTDWATMIKQDMKRIKLNLSFEEISMSPKNKFKRNLKELCERACLEDYLQQKSGLSKGKMLSYNSLSIQSYFKSKNALSADSMRKIYALRTRSLPLKCNAPSQYSDKLCLVPDCLEEDREEYVFSCVYLSEGGEVLQTNIKYEDIFAINVQNQEIVKDIFFLRYTKRSKYLPSMEGPEAPQDNQPSGSRE